MKTIEKIIAGLFFVGSMALSTSFVGRLVPEAARRDTARRAAMAVYEPVGNGGALYEMGGGYDYASNQWERRLSPRRKLMYETMERVYFAAMGKAPTADKPIEHRSPFFE